MATDAYRKIWKRARQKGRGGGRETTREGLPHFGRNMKTAKTAGNSSSESWNWTRDRERKRERVTDGQTVQTDKNIKREKQQLGKTLNITKLLKERQERKEVETSR